MHQASTPTSTASRILKRIRSLGRGSVFVPVDFLDLGSREAVDTSLGRLAAQGTIRRIGRGVYDFPRSHQRFGPRSPSADAVAGAVARSHGESICHDGTRAANLLGLSTQVPAQAIYLTDGTNRTFHVDLVGGRGFDIRFKRSRRLTGGNSKAGLALRALRHLGRDGIDGRTIAQLRTSLDDKDTRELQRLRPRAAGWLRAHVDRVLAGPEAAA